MSDNPVSLEKKNFPVTPAMLMALIITVSSILMLPGFVVCYHRWNVHFFSTGAIVLLTAGFLCFVPDRLRAALKALPNFAKVCFGLLFLIGVYHVIRHRGFYQLQDIGICFLYTVVPLFGMVFRKELLQLLPWTFSAFWLLNIISTGIQKYYFRYYADGGIAANINWNATFTFITGAALIYLILTGIPDRKKQMILSAFVILPSLFLEIHCASKGFVLALLIMLVALVWLHMKTEKAKRIFRIAMLFVILAGLTAVFFGLKSPRVQHVLDNDDRVFLAATVPDMILHAPVLGYGAPSFEQEYLPYRNAGFFFLENVADRVDHPHNDTLYTAAGYGIPGAVCWLVLCLFPLLSRLTRKHDTQEKPPFVQILFFCFGILWIHAQLDLIFFHIPLAILSMLILGILWGELYPVKEDIPVNTVRGIRIGAGVLGIGIILCGIVSVVTTLISYHLIWLGEGELMVHKKVTPLAEKYFLQVSLIPQAPPFALVTAATRSYIDGKFRPYIILPAAAVLDHTAVRDYGHMHLLRARAYEEIGAYQKAEKYYLKENEMFPVLVLPLMHVARVYLKTNQKEKFLETQRSIHEIMQLRGLDARDIELIKKYPKYDMRPWEIPKSLRTHDAITAPGMQNIRKQK